MKKIKGIARRKKRIRRKISGTSVRPRLSVHRSNKNFYVQLVDDMKGETLLSISTTNPDLKKSLAYGGNAKAASVLGEALANKAKAKGISKVVFDRAGYKYHGRVKALADAARKGGISF